MRFQLVPKSVTLNGVMALHCVISLILVNLRSNRVDLCTAQFMHESIVFCSVAVKIVRVRYLI